MILVVDPEDPAGAVGRDKAVEIAVAITPLDAGDKRHAARGAGDVLEERTGVLEQVGDRGLRPDDEVERLRGGPGGQVEKPSDSSSGFSNAACSRMNAAELSCP